MSADLKTEVEAFSVDAGPRGSVHVITDDDLCIRFLRGKVALSNVENTDALMALCLGVDGEPIDLVVCSGDEPLFEVLARAQVAIETALKGDN
jgi:hypothetical protein